MRAEKLSKRAASVGFDWPDWQQAKDKCTEELAEVSEAVEAGEGVLRIAEEVGDLLFSVASLARHLGVDPEAALRGANLKFTRRFTHIEHRAAEIGQALDQLSLAEMEVYWNEVRQNEKSINS